MASRASLAEFQRDFAAALLGASGPPGAASVARLVGQPGFAVHRNTVMLGCVEALAANYPTAAQLLGDSAFREAATAFVPDHLPVEGGLASYGEGFGEFLAGSPLARELGYLSDVARLDRAWIEAHLAADAPALASRDLACLVPEALAGAVLVPHPSARWLRFASTPAFTIWRRHRESLPLDDALPWQGESALLVRPAAAVEWHAIDAASAAFLSACAQARSFVDSIAAAEGADPGAAASLADWFPRLVAAGAFARVDAGGRDDNDPAID